MPTTALNQPCAFPNNRPRRSRKLNTVQSAFRFAVHTFSANGSIHPVQNAQDNAGRNREGADAMSDSTNARTRMLCPRCAVTLSLGERQGIEIDYCPECRGVWLDSGELDKLVERSLNAVTPPAIRAIDV